MIKSDFKHFGRIMTAMADIFGGEMTEVGMEFRFRALEDLSIDDVERAAKEILKTRKYTKMPTPGEFREKIEGMPEDYAEIEAGRVLHALKSVGHNDSVDFQDSITHAVIQNRFGGWVKMCSELMADQEGWFLKDFAKTYAVYARNGQNGRPGHLAGLIEEQNSASGHHSKIPAPCLIEGGMSEEHIRISNEHNPKFRGIIEDLSNKLKPPEEKDEDTRNPDET